MNKREIAAYAKRAKRVDKDYLITQICSGKKVLDVGCIGQDRNFSADNWLHNKVRAIAHEVDGVDILLEEIKLLRDKGYSILSVDELTKSPKKYDVILMADVIEHVNDPVAFLTFYSSFMIEGGIIFISTPNSNRSSNFINILFNNNYSVNAEHTFWFCPKTFSEVVERSGLVITDFHWSDNYYTIEKVQGVYQKFKFIFSDLLLRLQSNFSPNMLFILSKHDGR